jgi:hypothetical protein
VLAVVELARTQAAALAVLVIYRVAVVEDLLLAQAATVEKVGLSFSGDAGREEIRKIVREAALNSTIDGPAKQKLKDKGVL